MKRLWIAAALAAGILIGGAAHVGARQRHPAPVRFHVVRAGETLWGIAARSYPQLDPREGLERVERANHLRPGPVRPGQRLVLPAR